MVASTLTAKGPCSPTNCFISGSSVVLPYIKKRHINSKVTQKESMTYWKKSWPDCLWSTFLTTQCGNLFQVALSGQIVASDMTLKQQQTTDEMVKNNERWAKTVTEMRTIPNAVENIHVRSPLQSSHGPPPKTVPVKALQLGTLVNDHFL